MPICSTGQNGVVPVQKSRLNKQAAASVQHITRCTGVQPYSTWLRTESRWWSCTLSL